MRRKVALQILEQNKKNYHKIARHFSETRQKRIWPDIESLRPYIKPGDKILDVGCGNGRLLQLFSDVNIDYTGLDNCSELIQEAKKQWPGENIKFLLGNILDLEFSASNFDAIFCLAVLYHIPSQELRQRAVANLAKVVRPGGYIFMTVWNLWQSKFLPYIRKNNFKKIFGLSKLDFNDFFLPWKNQRGEITAKRYCHAFRLKELENLVQKTGLKVLPSKVSSGGEGEKYNIVVIGKK